MKVNAWKQLKRFLVPALTAALLGLGSVACSSSDEGAAEGADPASAVEGSENANNAENPDANANAEGNNDALAANGGQTPEDQVAPEENMGNIAEGNPAGNELQQMVNEGGDGTAAANDNTGLNNTANEPMASADAGGEVPPPPADVALPEAVSPDGALPPGNAMAAAEVPAVSPEAAPAAQEPVAADPFVADGGAAPASAASTPVAGALPENGAKMAYYIQKGDTLATIAQKIFGNRALWKTLQSENNLSDPNLIYAGDVVYYSLNDSARPFAEKYESAARQSVTVQAGDSLSKIARKVFGSEFEWRTLWKENPHVKNPDLLKAGTVLTYRTAEGATAQAAPQALPEMPTAMGEAVAAGSME